MYWIIAFIIECPIHLFILLCRIQFYVTIYYLFYGKFTRKFHTSTISQNHTKSYVNFYINISINSIYSDFCTKFTQIFFLDSEQSKDLLVLKLCDFFKVYKYFWVELVG